MAIFRPTLGLISTLAMSSNYPQVIELIDANWTPKNGTCSTQQNVSFLWLTHIFLIYSDIDYRVRVMYIRSSCKEGLVNDSRNMSETRETNMNISQCKKSTLTLCTQIDNHTITCDPMMIRSLVNGWDFCIVWFLFLLLLNTWSTGWCLSYFWTCCWYCVSNNTLTPTLVCFIFDCNCCQVVIETIFVLILQLLKSDDQPPP